MNKSLNRVRLKFACALGAMTTCGAAQAVYLNPQGLGEALVYPYYTVNGGQDTLVTLTNQGRDAKAVKVRFLEGYNSRDVLDVNVYLAVGDVWTAAVTANGDGAKLITSDPSCTVPDIAGSAQHSIAFTTRAFDGSTPQGTDGGPTGLSRVREGHIEVVEMGVVTGASEKALSPAYVAVPHSGDYPNQSGGAPIDCARLHAAWASGGYWNRDATIDLATPSGGLTGSAMIVNVARGTVQAYMADALADFHLSDQGREHTAFDALQPNLASATSLSAVTYANGAPSTLAFSRGIDAVTGVFMSGTISNEFWVSPALGANSEWVVTFPTRRFYTDPYYVGQNPAAPFSGIFGMADENCLLSFAIAVHDGSAARSGNVVESGYLGSPLVLAPATFLCHATQVVTFRQGAEPTEAKDFSAHPPSRILASNLVAANVPVSFDAGWARFGFAEPSDQPDSGQTFLLTADGQKVHGQPVAGFLAAQFVNGSVQGALANYTLALRHRTDARCELEWPESFCLP